MALELGVGFAPQLVIDTSGIADKINTIAVNKELPPLTVGLCSLKQRLDSPLVRSLWDIAQKTNQLENPVNEIL
jgi:LysR family positive regulator for ilvC